ncbi:hypothetical protein BGZ82_003062 [Podila clonocystis]|nr:hypothetical protein BGZ82_003062 [Podila clonocystis]
MEHTHTLQQITVTTTPSPPPTPTQTSSTTPTSRYPSSSKPCPSPHFDVINHSVHDTLQIVAALLSMAVQRNDRKYNPLTDPVTLFHSRAVPRISIEAYLTRILQYIPFTNEVLLNVLVFLERIGGLEGMQLKALSKNNNNAESSTSTAASSLSCTAPPSPRSSSSCSSSSEEGTTSLSSSSARKRTCTSDADPFSCSVNSDSIFPMIQKRGRDGGQTEEHEAASTHDGKRHKSTSTMTTSGTADTRPSSSQSQPQYQPYVPVSPATTPMTTPLSPSIVSCSPSQEQEEHEQAVLPKNGFRINSFNIHRLLITTVMVAAKFTSDLFYSNARYAKVGGLNLPELNQLELEFLFTSRFELNVKVDEIQRVGDSLLQFRAELVQQQQQQQQMMMMSRMMMMATPSTLPAVTSAYPAHPAQFYQPAIFVQAVEQPKVTYCPTATSIPSPATSTTSSTVSTPAMVTPVPAPAFAASDLGARPHLLSPPEEKRSWTETEVQEF